MDGPQPKQCACGSFERVRAVTCISCKEKSNYCAKCYDKNECPVCEDAFRKSVRGARGASSLPALKLHLPVEKPKPSSIEVMDEEEEDPEEQPKKLKRKERPAKKKEKVEKSEEQYYSGKSKKAKTTTKVVKKCKDADIIPDLPIICCKHPKDFRGVLTGKNYELLPLGKMFRTIFNLLSENIGPLPESGGSDAMKLICLAYDISHIWYNATGVFGSCAQYKFNDEMLRELFFLKKERPKTMSVASCHPTAENLTELLKAAGKGVIQKQGWLGAVQSEQHTFTKHNRHRDLLIASIRTAPRGIWWISHCGHSFCLIKRESVGRIEVIDSFANNRGLGYWALEPAELLAVEAAIPEDEWRPPPPESSPKEEVNWYFHVPPQRCLWSVDEMAGLIKNLVDKNLETRQGAQEALVNYKYETPTISKKDWFDDQLPYGAFGFVQYDLCPDQQILLTLGQKFFHGYDKLLRLQNEPVRKIRPLLKQQGVEDEELDKIFK